jgi:hypothetical protein
MPVVDPPAMIAMSAVIARISSHVWPSEESRMDSQDSAGDRSGFCRWALPTALSVRRRTTDMIDYCLV